MPPEQHANLIADIRNQDVKLKAWCAFSDINVSKDPPNGDVVIRSDHLQNVTVGVKDIIDVAGLPTKCGSAIYAHANAATLDAACVSMMRAAGAVIVGKTVTTELAMFVPAQTCNPVNLDYSPGGSSAGSAAAVAAGHVDIAIGTQTAGSILRPAAYCGVFGFKPTFGLVPRTGVKVQSETLDTVGVFARSIQHCAAWLAAMNGSPTSLAPDDAGRKLKIGVVTSFDAYATADMLAAVRHARHTLMTAGHEVVELPLPEPLAQLHTQQMIIQQYESARAYHAERTQHRALLTPAIATALDEGARIADSTYRRAMAAANEARPVADKLFKKCDVWLLPAAPGAAPFGLASTGDPIFNRLASVLHTPSISVPALRDGNGMPLGLQLIGMRGGDQQLFRAAATICAALATA